MSSLSVAWAPYYVKETELGNSHFLSQWHGQSEVVTIGCGTGTKIF